MWLTGDRVETVSVKELETCLVNGAESFELFKLGLNHAKTLYPNVTVHLVTDLSPEDDLFLRLRRDCSDSQFEVHSLTN